MAHMMRKMKDLMAPGAMLKELDVAIKLLEADMGDLLGDFMGGPEGAAGTGSYMKDSGLTIIEIVRRIYLLPGMGTDQRRVLRPVALTTQHAHARRENQFVADAQIIQAENAFSAPALPPF